MGYLPCREVLGGFYFYFFATLFFYFLEAPGHAAIFGDIFVSRSYFLYMTWKYFKGGLKNEHKRLSEERNQTLLFGTQWFKP